MQTHRDCSYPYLLAIATGFARAKKSPKVSYWRTYTDIAQTKQFLGDAKW